MLRIGSTLLLLWITVVSHAADDPPFEREAYLLHTTLDETDPRWNFNHDVKVRSTGEQLTLTVLGDLNLKAQTAEGDDSEIAKHGLGRAVERDSPRPDQRYKPLFSSERTLHGIVDDDGGLKFGVTTILDGKLLSLHYVGRRSLGGASGKVYLLSPTQPVREGKWYLKNSASRGGSLPGFNGTNPLGR